MKRTIIFWLAALFAFASLQAQEVKSGRYIIDGKVVKDFNGSQLIGKTITSYSIGQEHNIHIIFTSAYQGDAETMKKDLQAALAEVTPVTADVIVLHDGEVKPGKPGKAIFVIDGKVVPHSELKELSRYKIASMTVIKNKQHPDYVKYARDAVKNGGVDPDALIIITTKP